MKVNVLDLADPCVTRRVGRNAFERLIQMNPQPPLIIDLSGARLLTASFLDELVLRLRERGLAEGLVFLVGTGESLMKLCFVARTRRIPLAYAEREEEEPKPVPAGA